MLLSHSRKFQAPTRKEEEGQSREANDTVPCLCSVSFHRNHTATVRSQAENATVSHVENEYSQPPRNSQVSAYAGKQLSPLASGAEAGCSMGHVITGSRDALGERGLSLPFDSCPSGVWKGSSLHRPPLASPTPNPKTVSHSAQEKHRLGHH